MRDPKAICHCGRQGSLEMSHREPSPIGTSESVEVLVCDLCDKIKFWIPNRRREVRGPKDARLSDAHLHKNGQSTLTWIRRGERIKTVEFKTYPRRIPMSDIETQPLIFRCWELLMSKMPLVMKAPEDPWDAEGLFAHKEAKQQARGVAETLAILMTPFMADADAVVKAAVKKYKDPDYEVPGLGEHLWDPSKNHDGSERTPVATPRSRPAAKPKAAPKPAAARVAKEAELSEADKEGIRTALESGMFDAKALAEMYKVNESTIAALA